MNDGSNDVADLVNYLNSKQLGLSDILKTKQVGNEAPIAAFVQGLKSISYSTRDIEKLIDAIDPSANQKGYINLGKLKDML